jgi:phosphatidylglycerol:prolipoprotein diacylglycerol transferase
MWRRRDHGHATGWMLGCYLLLGGLERFLIEFLRAKDDRLLGAFTVAQATSVALVVVGAVLLRLWWKPDAVSAQPAVLAALPKRAPPPPG